MKKLSIFLMALCFATALSAQISYLQYRHVPADHEDKFVERETKHWSKVAQAAIKKGQMSSWSLWKKVGVTNSYDTTPNYVIVNTFESLDNMDMNKVWSDNMDALGDVKPEDVETMSFTTTTFDYFVQREDYIDGNYKFALVNYGKPTDLTAFIQENRSLWKPLHQASIENIMNAMTYWGMSSVIYPVGNLDRFSVFTVDGFNKLNDALDYLRFTETSDNSPNAAAWNDVIDKTKMDELMPNGFERRIIYERVLTVK
ncbi:hypothetical protein [Lutimonas zeaxanthinifaciens]|uniref:hypothetical protein n=1 Tax=Lutimonas zeaxanthinifaciens TaxID=3060215 RepID=UPI00265D5370|nr:hypothetical protein [Lutimonas sp. YSD2104]WKK65678.1 hypothetical protein QZH61_13945 [Lutimonas sp. YSD2104]